MLKYDKVRDFYNGYAAVCVGDKWGFINSHGNEICELKYDRAWRFCNGRAFVGIIGNHGGRFGFINDEGKEICELKYNYIKPVEFDYGAVVVKLGDKYGYIDIDGNVIGSIEYDRLSFPICFVEDGVAAVQVNGKWGVINKRGEKVCPTIYDSSKDAFESVGVKVKGEWL